MSAITLSDCRTALASLYGDASAPNETIRDSFINLAIKDIYSRRLWKWRRARLNVVFNSSGVSTTTLTNFTIDSFPVPNSGNNLTSGEARLINSSTQDDVFYKPIAFEDRDKYVAGDCVIWVDGNEVDGYTLNIKETTAPTLSVTYFRKADVLSASTDTTYIPYVNAIAKLAYAFLVKNDDLDRNNSKELGDAENEIGKLTAMSGGSVAQTYAPASAQQGHYAGKVS